MPGYGARYWAERTADNRRRAYPKFKGHHTADAVVIGGGLTGAAAAYALSSAGAKVILLEADRIATGSTAAGFGAVLPQPDALFRAVEVAAGRRVARTAWQEARRSAREFGSVLRKLSVKCDVADSALVINARVPEDAQELRRDQAAMKAASLDAPWLTPAAAQADIATDSFGALRLRDAFTFDPVRATLGLAGAAEKHGAQIFEGSAVRRTRFTRRIAQVVLSSGTIKTTCIVVATGEPGAVFSQLRRHTRRETGYAVVTHPMLAPMRHASGKRTSVVTDAGAAPYWWRWLSEDRVLFAGARSRTPGARLRDKSVVQRTAQLMYELSVRYPAISGLPAAWGWDVPVVSTPDGLPWIGPHRNYPFHFFALAFGWHGDGLAWLAARAAVRFLRGEATRDDDAFGFVRHL
ncbi:MAG TPA: FAD-binding oxidoreductase [Vicinamibacterales bacterium]|nr:FAD-binding oxidoreductase [Vicinamibacterales bacterium]